MFVNYYNIRWTNTNEIDSFVTYLDEEEIDIGDIAAEQKSRDLKYKNFTSQEILERKEYLWNRKTQELYGVIKARNNSVLEYSFRKIIKMSEIGENILDELLNIYVFEDEREIQEFMNLFMEWYNNSPQYPLGGYSPVEFGKFK